MQKPLDDTPDNWDAEPNVWDYLTDLGTVLGLFFIVALIGFGIGYFHG